MVTFKKYLSRPDKYSSRRDKYSSRRDEYSSRRDKYLARCDEYLSRRDKYLSRWKLRLGDLESRLGESEEAGGAGFPTEAPGNWRAAQALERRCPAGDPTRKKKKDPHDKRSHDSDCGDYMT